MFEQAKEEGKVKKAEKLQQAREAAAVKAAALAGKPPIVHAVRHEKELRSLYKKASWLGLELFSSLVLVDLFHSQEQGPFATLLHGFL